MLKSVEKAGRGSLFAAWWNALQETLSPWDPERGGLDQGVSFPDPCP